MKYEYKTKGTCSTKITFDLNDGIVSNIEFTGGCHGNLQGIAALAQGQPAAKIIHTLEPIRCQKKPTSCPHQLSIALSQALEQEEKFSEKKSS